MRRAILRWLIHLCDQVDAGAFVALRTWLAARCDHAEVVRYWLPRHYYIRVCKTCNHLLGRGRDKSHRYPDDAPGVARGVRSKG